MDPQRPSRPATTAYIVVTALLTLILAAAAVEIVLAAVGALRGGHTISIARAAPPDQLASLPPGVQPRSSVPVTQTITDASPVQLLLRVASDLGPLLLLAVPALWLLRSLVRSLRHGDPFTPANAQRLRGFGFLVLLGWPVVSLVTHVLQEMLALTVPAEQQLGGPDWAPIPVPALLTGLGVLVLAEVFARGVRLREDVEGTI